jgi:16S rRNA (uracil1498-N3)-methyltransferase
VAVINNKQFIDPPIYELLLAVAPTKNQGRFDTMVEKCTELGCSQFIPLISRHSERRNINLDRLKKITVSALKQSGRLYLPQVSTAHLFDELIEKIKDYEQKFIAHCHIATLPFLGKLAERGGKVAVLIGPEGDFSREEVEKSKAYGFEEVSLGSYRLRTETAGMFVCSILATVNQ